MIRILGYEYLITHDDTSSNYIVLLDRGLWFDRCFSGTYDDCLAYVRGCKLKDVRTCRNI